MKDEHHSKDYIDLFHQNIIKRIEKSDETAEVAFKEIKTRLDYTNGKLRRHTVILLVVGTAVATLLFTSGSDLLNFIKIII